MRELALLESAYGQSITNVESLTLDDLHRPTPCPEWDVQALLVHMTATSTGLVAMMRDQAPDWDKDELGEDPAPVMRRALTAALAAWSQPGATEVPSGQMPGMRLVDFAMADALAHGWDLAAALGRPLEIDDALIEMVHERWDGEPAETGRKFGVFGRRVEVPSDAPVLDRFLGSFGRDPHYVAT